MEKVLSDNNKWLLLLSIAGILKTIKITKLFYLHNNLFHVHTLIRQINHFFTSLSLLWIIQNQDLFRITHFSDGYQFYCNSSAITKLNLLIFAPNNCNFQVKLYWFSALNDYTFLAQTDFLSNPVKFAVLSEDLKK